MDHGGKITGAALGDKGAIEDSMYKVLRVFDWKVKCRVARWHSPKYRTLCLWHRILSYLHMHCPVLGLLSFLHRTKSQNTGQFGYTPDTWRPCQMSSGWKRLCKPGLRGRIGEYWMQSKRSDSKSIEVHERKLFLILHDHSACSQFLTDSNRSQVQMQQLSAYLGTYWIK